MIVDDPLNPLELLYVFAPKLIVNGAAIALLAFIAYQVIYRAVLRAVRDALGIKGQSSTTTASKDDMNGPTSDEEHAPRGGHAAETPTGI